MRFHPAITRACLATVVGGAALLTGCTHRTVVYTDDDHHDHEVVRTQREVVVVEAPPAPQVESRPQPRPGYVWVDGYYRHDGKRYSWVPGHWERPPRTEARYVPGRWDRTDRGYIFIEGRWD